MSKLTLRKMLRLLAPMIFPRFRRNNPPPSTMNAKPEIDMVTSWNTRCGIATYSAFLAAELRKLVKLRIIDVPDNMAFSPYFLVLGYKTGRAKTLAHVQFAYGIFSDLNLGKSKSLTAFTALLFYVGLAFGNNQVVTTFHELMKDQKAGNRLRLIYTKLLNKLICNVSTLIIVHTHEGKKVMEKVYGVDKSKVKIVPMGTLENPIFLNKEDCKRKLGLSGKRVITLPGFVSTHKGYDLTIRLLPHLDMDVHLLIAGGTRTNEDAAYCEKLKQLALQLNCADRVSFNDDFPISPTILNATDIAILPYTWASESMALRLLVAYQVPTITSDLSVFQEIFEEYGCMELFKTGDSRDLLTKTKALLSDGKRRLELKRNCQKMWSATKWSLIAAKHVETYMEVSSAHPDALYDSEKQKERLDWLKTHLSGNTLEIGCATGYVANYTGSNVGLDLNVNRLRLAKKRYREKDFVVSDAVNLPFGEKTFNTVLIPEILEHLPLPLAEKVVSEGRRVGDKLLATLPNAGKPNYDKSLVETPEHLWFPTEENVLKLIRDCKIEYTREKDFILVQA